jgi:hypothetical protein
MLAPTTDGNQAQFLASGWDLDQLVCALLTPNTYRRPVINIDEVSATIGMLAVDLVVPDLRKGHVPIEKIINVRNRYGADFLAFHEEVQALAAAITKHVSTVEDPAVLRAYLRHEASKHLIERANELRRILTGLKIETTTGVLQHKFDVPPSLLAAGIGLGGAALTDQPVIAAASGVAAGVLTTYGRHRQTRAATMRPSAATYLLHVDKQCRPSTLMHDLAGRLRSVARSRKGAE